MKKWALWGTINLKELEPVELLSGSVLADRNCPKLYGDSNYSWAAWPSCILVAFGSFSSAELFEKAMEIERTAFKIIRSVEHCWISYDELKISLVCGW